MNTSVQNPARYRMLLLCMLLLFFSSFTNSYAQMFNFKTTEASTIVSGDDLHVHGFPDTLITWCNDWDFMINNATWRDSIILKSNVSFVKFYVNNFSSITRYLTSVDYSYHLAFHIYGFTDPADSLTAHGYVTNSDTLTINYNNINDNTPFQDLNLKKYNNFYKLMVIVDAIYADSAGIVVPALLTDEALRTFNIEGAIVTQHYDKRNYGSGTDLLVVTETPHPLENFLDLSWAFPSGPVTPINYQLEWTYVDDYSVDVTRSREAPIRSSDLIYDFSSNSTRVWLEDNDFHIPLIYPRGYVVYRVRAVRPDSDLYRYPVYGDWSLNTPDRGTISSLSAGYYYNSFPYTSDRLNWQYTASFAEGGKYKNVASFYDGLLKLKQSITRFNSALDKLIATTNIYDNEGRLSIKTLPVPINSTSFSYQYDVAVNSATNLPYQAADFDTGSLRYGIISPLATNALANIYYSNQNPDTLLRHQRFIADAEGYPMVQTIYGSDDRIAAQGGAGAALQIGDPNYITNSYVGAPQPLINSLFGPNVGWSNFYTMTVSRDPDQQYSMSIKDMRGKQMVTALIGTGPSPVTHALDHTYIPNPHYLNMDVLAPDSSQAVDVISGTRIADVDYFSEEHSADSVQYNYKFNPYEACPGQFLFVKGHYSAWLTNQYGDVLLTQDTVLGSNRVDTSGQAYKYSSATDNFLAEVGPYHVHKTLTISPADVDIVLDSFFKEASCFYNEPYFIRQSVEATTFPCPGDVPGTPGDSIDECTTKRWEMMQQLFPTAAYAQYTMPGTELIGGDNSIYTIVGCPTDTFHLTKYYPDSVYWYCYDPVAVPGGDTSVIISSQGGPWGIVDYRCFCTSLSIPDTCAADTAFTTTVTITAHDLFDSTWSIYIPFRPDIAGMEGNYLLRSNWNLGVANGDIYANGINVGHITQFHSGGYDSTVITLPLNVHGNLFSADLHANILTPTGDSLLFSFTGLMSPDHIDSMHHFAHPYPVDSTALNTASPLCHYRYQDTCTVPSLSDTVVINGVPYTGIRSMSADSFTLIYNEAIAAHNYSIAEALLPLHPQYCELRNCYTDTFRAQLLSLPDWRIAQSMGRLYLDSIIAHDPLKGLMLATGHFPSPADSLRTFRGGNIRIDSFIFANAYCLSTDPAMYQQCISNMFGHEIANHLLINDNVKKTYFDYIINSYITNRQRFVDSILRAGGNTCAHCADARMTLDPAFAIFPAPVRIDTAMVPLPGFADPAWASAVLGDTISADSLQSLYDSTVIAYHADDSSLYVAAVNTIIGEISNCLGGDAVLEGNVRHSLETIYNSGGAPAGDFTQAQLYDVLQSNGIAVSDLCNPYVISRSEFGAVAGVANCMASDFYEDLGSLLNNVAVGNALQSLGSVSPAFSLDTVHGLAEKAIARKLGNIQDVDIWAGYDMASYVYTIYIIPSGGGADTVKVLLHSSNCHGLFSTLSPGGYTVTTACSGSASASPLNIGLVNQYSFIATVTYSGAYCTMVGWVDKVRTRITENDAIPHCMPCTQMRRLCAQFADTLQAYGIQGMDHPYFTTMLANFMNDKLQQQYSSDDYETFIQSCALADSMLLPLYVGYATLKFSSTADVDAFIAMLNAVDPSYSFNDAYRESTMVGGVPEITVIVDLNTVPKSELWKYKAALINYVALAFVPISNVINRPLTALQPAGQIGFLYADPAFPFSPSDSNIIDPATGIIFSGPFHKDVWIAGSFVTQDYYDVIQTGATPYDISRAIYNITAYLYNNDIPGAVFTPEYRSTIDADYFKPEKQAYLKYTYDFQHLPDYEVLDQVQAHNLVANIPSYAPYNAVYSKGLRPGLFTNLYLWNAGMSGRYYDTLQRMISLTSATGHIFNTASSVSVTVPSGALNAYICSDGSYWYRYFTTGDTLFNAYLSFPSYIPRYLRSSYRVAGPVIPMPGDSINRYFALNVTLPGSPDTLLLYGLASFEIGRSNALSNVLLGLAPANSSTGVDTFDNCERQTFFSAVNSGIVNYHNYIDSVRSKISGDFKAYALNNVGESLIVQFTTNQLQRTLYNYDRAGNLTSTITPAGFDPLPDTGDVPKDVDTSRLNNTPGSCPVPSYYKKNTYTYTSFDQVREQTTINGGRTRFMYDAAGRLIFSQNAQQANSGAYTYNLYDAQSRIIETGQVLAGCPYFDPYETNTLTGAPACSNAVSPVSPAFTWLVTPDPDQIAHVDLRPYDSVVSFIRSFDRNDVVSTIYDTVARHLERMTGFDAQENLRKRVSCVKYLTQLSPYDTAYADYDHATHYSYDAQGNVQTLVQDHPTLAFAGRQYVRVDYDYDVISGKVNMLSYARGLPDQFYQRYEYDADNRITAVHTSSDGYIWNKEAGYTYYDHGPLARVDVGDLRVQGIDYAYTIQGWLKVMNADSLNTNMDMGRDGGSLSITAHDAVAHTIDYFNGDYRSITGRQVGSAVAPLRSLYNGNIARQTVAIDTFIKLNKQYVYDQLNRIVKADNAVVDPASGALTGIADFHSRYSYDPDGNIQQLIRYGNNTGSGALVMDSLYYKNINTICDQLGRVSDSAGNNYTNDIPQSTAHDPAGTYTYDRIGRVTMDGVSGQSSVKWNLYDKVIRTSNPADTSTMEFEYDGMGNRVAKHYIKSLATGKPTKDEYYLRDAQGNILAIYRGFRKTGYKDLALAEHDVYGSSRLGAKQYYGLEIGRMADVANGVYDTVRFISRQPWYSLEYQDVIKADSMKPWKNQMIDAMFAKHVTGLRQYELTDHLGDVLATVSDKRSADEVSTGPGGVPGDLGSIKSWKPIVVTAHDHYPFGMYMPGRYTADTATHCVTTTYSAMLTSMYYPMIHGIDLVADTSLHAPGALSYTYTDTMLNMHVYDPGVGLTSSFGISDSGDHIDVNVDTIAGGPFVAYTLAVFDDATGLAIGSRTQGGGVGIGIVRIPLSIPHSHDVYLQVTSFDTTSHISIRDVRIPRDTSLPQNFVSTVCNTDAYRFGYNGKMKDDQWAGIGNHYDYGFREYDPRIARFITIDPIAQKFPWLSPYIFAGNTPIQAIDLEGLEILKINSAMYRMRFDGNVPMVGKANALSVVPVSHIEMISENTPTAYPTDYSFNVGTNGHDNSNAKPYSGPVMKQAAGSELPSFEDDGMVGSKAYGGANPGLVDRASIGEKAYSGVAAAVEVFKTVANGIKDNITTFAVTAEEPRQRSAFYKATTLVDAVLNSSQIAPALNNLSKMNDIGNFRADVINYVTDGTSPRSYRQGMTNKQKESYNNAVKEIGNNLMIDNDIEIKK